MSLVPYHLNQPHWYHLFIPTGDGQCSSQERQRASLIFSRDRQVRGNFHFEVRQIILVSIFPPIRIDNKLLKSRKILLWCTAMWNQNGKILRKHLLLL